MVNTSNFNTNSYTSLSYTKFPQAPQNFQPYCLYPKKYVVLSREAGVPIFWHHSAQSGLIAHVHGDTILTSTLGGGKANISQFEITSIT